MYRHPFFAIALLALPFSSACRKKDKDDTTGQVITDSGHENVETGTPETGTPDSGDTAPDSGDSGDGLVDADKDGFIASDDCNDNDPLINPDATETCNDGVDNDCDPNSSHCEIVLDDKDIVLTGEAENDNAGYSIAAGDLNGDGLPDLVVGAKQHDAVLGDEGATYIAFGPLTEDQHPLSTKIKISGTESGEKSANKLAILDFDGDGTEDLFITAITADADAVNAGKVYWFSGATIAGWIEGETAMDVSDADYIWTGESGSVWVGGGLASGDFDGDGQDDLIIGSTGDNEGGASAGAIYIVPGGNELPFGETQGISETAIAKLIGEAQQDYAGANPTGPGDMDGDGFGDIVVGVNLADNNGDSSGVLYLARGPFSGTSSLGDVDVVMIGDTAGIYFGSAVSAAGDVDQDGYPDAWVGASRLDNPGSQSGGVWLLPGSADLATELDSQSIEDVAKVTIYGSSAGDGLGVSLSGNVDWDGDGTLDLLAGASTAGDQSEGAAYLFLGPLSGTLEPSIDSRLAVYGDALEDKLGTAVGFGGDLLGTGGEILVIGAWQDNNGSGSDAGTVWLVGDLTE